MKFWIIFLLLVSANLLFAQNFQELGQLYVDKKYDVLMEECDSLLKEDPENTEVNLIKGRVLVDQEYFAEGKPFIQKAIANDKKQSWRKAWGLNYLEIIEYASGNKEKAKECWQTCLYMNATQNVSKRTKTLLILLGLDDYYNDFEKIETEHFTFSFQPGISIDKNEFTHIRENAFTKICSFFNSKLPKKIEFIVWNNEEDAKKLGLPKLGFAQPEACCVHTRANQTPGHEMTHVISHYLGKKPVKTRFINEGISVAFDQTNMDKLESAKSLKQKDGYKDRISIIEAWENPNKYPEWVYYPLAGEFIKRLKEKGGESSFLKLVVNQSYNNAKEIYGKTLDEVIDELEKSININ